MSVLKQHCKISHTPPLTCRRSPQTRAARRHRTPPPPPLSYAAAPRRRHLARHRRTPPPHAVPRLQRLGPSRKWDITTSEARGGWVDPHKLFLEDGAKGKAKTLVLLETFYRVCKPFAPVKLGGALLITPDIKRFVGRRRLAVVPLDEAATAAVKSVLGGDVYRTLAPRRLGGRCSRTSSSLLPTGLRPGSYRSEMRTNLASTRSCSLSSRHCDQWRTPRGRISSRTSGSSAGPMRRRSTLRSRTAYSAYRGFAPTRRLTCQAADW